MWGVCDVIHWKQWSAVMPAVVEVMVVMVQVLFHTIYRLCVFKPVYYNKILNYMCGWVVQIPLQRIISKKSLF